MKATATISVQAIPKLNTVVIGSSVRRVERDSTVNTATDMPELAPHGEAVLQAEYVGHQRLIRLQDCGECPQHHHSELARMATDTAAA